MTIYGKFEKALVMTKKIIDSKKDVGKHYYSLGVVANNELGEIHCTEDDFSTQYRTEYQMFSLSGVNAVHKGSLFDNSDAVADKK